MGQSNTKDQGAHNVQNGSGNGLAIQSAPTFDSHFTLISPKSDLSDPSKFFYQPPEVKNPQLMKGPHLRLERTHSQVVFHNMPVIPDSKKKNEKTAKKKLTYHKKTTSSRRLSKGGERDGRTKTQRVKDAFAGCIVASSEQTQKMRDVSNNIVWAASMGTKKSEDGWTSNKVRNTDFNAALATGGEKNIAKMVSDERKRASLSTAAKSSLEIEQEKPKSSPNNGWSGKIEETVTPLAQLDTCFKKVCLHQEGEYFDRLTGSKGPSPSPVANGETDLLNSIQEVNADTSPPIPNPTSRSGVKQYESMQKTFGQDSTTGQESRVKIEETIPCGKSSAIDISQTDHQDQERSIGGAFFRLSANQRRKSTESHRRRAATKDIDYRNIALSKSEGNSPGPTRLVPSPSNSVASSTMSSVAGCPRGALVGDQALSNAAFLFSPSYAGGDAGLLKRQKKYRDPAFSISTFASRARLSNVSSRSQPAVIIPVSKSWDSRSSTDSRTKRYDFTGANSVDPSNKQVRFSNSNETFEIQKASEDKRNLLREIETPVIEMKLSDLTESTVLQNKTNIDEASAAMTASKLSQYPERGHMVPGSALKAEHIPSSNSEEDNESTTSSERRGSIHWAYREEDGKITATPKLGKKWCKNGAQPSKSPGLRFHAAKAKFSVCLASANEHHFSDLSNSSDSASKQVRFSDSNETLNSVKNQIEQIGVPSIEMKMSDLTEGSLPQSQADIAEASVGKTTSSLSLGAHSREGSLTQEILPSYSEDDCQRTSSSEQQGSINLAYPEEHGKVTTKGNDAAHPATSPLKRFNAAKHKFSGQRTKTVPIKKTPPKKFSNRTPKKTLVSSRISELRCKLTNDIHPQILSDTQVESISAENGSQQKTNFEIEKKTGLKDTEDVADFAGDHFVTEESIVTTEDLFTTLLRSETDIDNHSSNSRCETIMNEKKIGSGRNDSIVNYQEQNPKVNEDAFDETARLSNNGERCVFADTEEVSISRADDVFTTLLRSNTETDDESVSESVNEPRNTLQETKSEKTEHRRRSSQYPGRPSISGEDHLSDLVKVDDDLVSIAATECSDDPFAGVLRSNYEVHQSAGTTRISTGSRNSVFSFATNSTNRESLDSYFSDKENSASLSAVHKITSGGYVNPVHAYHPENPSNLCLSPTQRTPMQARKWRTLAAASTEKQNSTKGHNRKRNNKGRRGGLLHDRSVNVR